MERDPAEVVADSAPEGGAGPVVLPPREVPLGGPRAMRVRRTLPSRARSLIGAWCFLDHYGPDDVAATGGMRVPPHPHTGLQTVSWLFEGEIEHRDSVGSRTLVTPGAVNLMTAGRGISHSETSTPQCVRLHGVQLWVALPDQDRFVDPFFEHAIAPVVTHDGADIRTFVGVLPLASVTAVPVTTFTPLVAAQIEIPAGAELHLPLDPTFEHGLLIDTGDAEIDLTPVKRFDLAYLSPGRAEVTIVASHGNVRLILIGGTPLTEEIVMWWNFVGRSHEEVVAFRESWQREITADPAPSRPFGPLPSTEYDGPALPAPEMPSVRLRPRNR